VDRDRGRGAGGQVRDERAVLAETQTGGRVIPACDVRQGDRFFGVLSGRWDSKAAAY
jgi:hypothetical protein